MIGVRLTDNFSWIIANGLSLIFSRAKIENCYIDNSLNSANISEVVINAVESGFFSASFQSEIWISNTSMVGLHGNTAGLIQSAGQAKIKIDQGSSLHDITGNYEFAIYASSLMEFELDNITLDNSHGFDLWNFIGENFHVSNSLIHPIGVRPSF